MERAFTPLDCLLPAGTVPPAPGRRAPPTATGPPREGRGGGGEALPGAGPLPGGGRRGAAGVPLRVPPGREQRGGGRRAAAGSAPGAVPVSVPQRSPPCRPAGHKRAPLEGVSFFNTPIYAVLTPSELKL